MFDLTVESRPVSLLLVRCRVGGALSRRCRNRDGCRASRSATGLEHSPIQLLSDFLKLNLDLLDRASEGTLGWIYGVGQFNLCQDFAGRGIFQNHSAFSEVDIKATISKGLTISFDLIGHEDVRHILIPIILQVDL